MFCASLRLNGGFLRVPALPFQGHTLTAGKQCYFPHVRLRSQRAAQQTEHPYA
jgi:hypothetical protein